MKTYAEYQAEGLTFLKEQLGKGYSEDPGQNYGPNTWDCQGLAYGTYASLGLTHGPGIGLIGSAEQFNLSTVKLQPSDLWLVLDQLFFWGGEPPSDTRRPGHTGIYVGPVVPGGAPMMISALDGASGVCYSAFNPVITGAHEGLSITGRTRPLLLIPGLVLDPQPAKVAPSMFLFQAPPPSINGYIFSGGKATLVPDGPDYQALKKSGIPEPPLSVAWRAHLATLV
jgi:hypothetical protein